MKKIIITAVLAIAVSTGVTFGAWYNAFNVLTANVQEQSFTNINVEKNELEEFHSIKINAMSPDIRVTEGEDYSVEYRLHDREHIEKLEVENGVLIFETGFNLDFDIDYSNFHINVTIPKGTELQTLELTSVDGDIFTDVNVVKNASLITTAGEVEINGTQINELQAKSTSENIYLNGTFENIDAHSTAGDLTIISENFIGELTTVSGNIEIETNQEALTASSFGEVRYNGDNKGYRYESGNNTLLTVQSVSGKIIIE